MTPLDTRIEEIGGVVFRRTRRQVRRTHHDRDAAAHRIEIEQLQAERAQASSGRLAKIGKIDRLGKKLEQAILRQRSAMLLREEQRDARIQTLRAKADDWVLKILYHLYR